MKKSILLLSLIVLCIGVKGQTKLPDTTHAKFTAKEITDISLKLDSSALLLQNTSTLPANQIAAFNRRVQMAFITLWQQVQKQIVEDAKKVQPKGKP